MEQYFIRHPAVAAPLFSLISVMVAAFASLGADAWGSTSTGATVVAAAPVRPQAGPQQPQVAPQQAGPHHATKQPTLAQGKEAMSSAGVGMAGGGGNPFKGIESPGLTAGTGVATGAAEQVCVCIVCRHPIYSGRQVCGRTSRGHTGFLHLPSVLRSFLSREGFSRSIPPLTVKSSFVY